MAEAYYTLSAPGVSYVLNKCMLGMYNGVGSGRVIRVKRAWSLNNQTAAVTGVGIVLQIQRFSTASGGYAIAPTKHDTGATSLPAQLTFATNPTFTTNAIIRNVFVTSDEPGALGVGTMDEVQTNPAYSLLLDNRWSYTDVTVEPIVLRPGYGFGIVVTAATGTITGVCDLFIEFSVDTI